MSPRGRDPLADVVAALATAGLVSATATPIKTDGPIAYVVHQPRVVTAPGPHVRRPRDTARNQVA